MAKSEKKQAEQVSTTTETVEKTKFDIFKENLKIQKQISPALRKVKTAIRAIENMQKKAIIKNYEEKLKTASTLFKEIETKLEDMIPG